MIVLQILIAVVATIGLGFILSDVFRIPKYPVSKAITALGKRQKKKTNPLDIWLGDLANRIADKLKLNEYKRLQLKADLDSADMTVSPEQYVANAIVRLRRLSLQEAIMRSSAGRPKATPLPSRMSLVLSITRIQTSRSTRSGRSETMTSPCPT